MDRRRLAFVMLAGAAAASAATRPRYGGTLRVEVRDPVETADPPEFGHRLADLNAHFSITQWIGGSRASYKAAENAPGGRPFLDAIEVQLARPLREQSIDLDLGKADITESDPSEARRAPARKTWTSSPVRVVAVQFSPRVEDARVREALAYAIDRAAIYNVLLQRQGEISGALVPQWISGFAFLFPGVQDPARARSLAGRAPAPARTLTFSVAGTADRRIADRIALDARDAGLTLLPVGSGGDVRLVELRIPSPDPAAALASAAALLGLPDPPRSDTPEAQYAAERAMLEGFRIVPLFHLPDVYGVGPRVKGGPAITPLGEWRFENLWLENARP